MSWENVLKVFGEYGYPEGDERNEQSRIAEEKFAKNSMEVLTGLAFSLETIDDLEVITQKPIGYLFEELAKLLELKADYLEEVAEIEGDTLSSRRVRPTLQASENKMRELAKKFRAKF